MNQEKNKLGEMDTRAVFCSLQSVLTCAREAPAPPAAMAAAATACSPRPSAAFRPHRSGDVEWAAIRALSATSPATPLGPSVSWRSVRSAPSQATTLQICRPRYTSDMTWSVPAAAGAAAAPDETSDGPPELPPSRESNMVE